MRLDSQADGICHVSLTGRISQVSDHTLTDQLQQLLGEANMDQKILMSLQEASFIDSSGIGWLLSTDKKIRGLGGRLVLHSLPLDVQHVFGLMKLHTVLRVAKNKQHADEVAIGELNDG